MKYKILFFDLDGTLANTLPDIKNSINYFLKLNYLPLKNDNEVKELIGNGARYMVEKCLVDTDISIDDTLRVFSDYYSIHYADFTKIYDNVLNVLRKLKNTNKIILTNKPYSISKKIVKKLGLAKYFKKLIAPEVFGFRKPNPASILKILEFYKLKPSDACMIGDSISDICAAKNADIDSICVSYGYGKKDDLKMADYVINDFKELLIYI